MTDATTFIFATSTALLLAMPGPTNALLAASGAARGFHRSVSLLLAEIGGYAIAIGLLLALDGIAGAFRSEIGIALRSVAAVLLLATAYRMWRDAGESASAGLPHRAPSAGSVFLLTLANPKSLILGFALFPPMIQQGALPLAAAVFVATAVLTGLGWIAAGAAARRLPGRPGPVIARLSSLVIGGFACYFAATAAADLIPMMAT